MAGTKADVRDTMEEFVHDLYSRLSERDDVSATHELEVVLSDDTYSLSSVELGSRPERFAESRLIYPLLDAVGLSHVEQPYGERGGTVVWPDFEVTNLDTKVIGENKQLNRFEEGVEEIKDYLDRKSIGAEYGVVTDGIRWRVFKIELGGDFTEYPEIEQASVDLRDALLAIAHDEGLIEQSGLDTDPDEAISAFVSAFERESFSELLSQTAPRRIRDRRKRDVEAFYELYIELLFGESDEYDYDTCLLDDIRFVGDDDPDPREKRLFAITLVNRLLFVKFLETREVLPEGFLRERVEHYREYGDEFAGNLYETQIRPLFYELLNTPKDDREPKHRDPDAWFGDVPYLNGGLFRENVEGESRYRVIDRILPDVIRDLIEGSRLELDGHGFDPALLGSVFEKTINHIEQERTQKDIGAYYTPNDVTEIVTEQSVDPKIRDVLVETFVDAVAADGGNEESGDAEDVRAYLSDLDLSELLRKIENCEEAVLSPQGDTTRVRFGDDETLAAAKRSLRELKVVDPACGSGHFLTTAMDEIHRAQESVLRGLADGDEPDDRTRFAEKKELALNAIYGVDVDRIAAEIAKLRVWLKIVEGNRWEPEFGKLPNIDVNITHGNSLVGLPLAGSFDDADVWSNDIGEIERKRIEYKRDDAGDPREIERYLDREIRPALDEKYLDLFSKPVETSIETTAEFDAVVESIDADTLYPTVSLVRVKREDSAAFSEEETEMLEEMGFSVYKKSAKRDVQEWESLLKTKMSGNGTESYDKSVLAEQLRDLLEGEYVFSEVQRQPTAHDLAGVLGKPFHWVAEFPEVAEKRGSTHSINFDIVLGNPPYGDLLGDEEKLFVSTYETNDVHDISANFVERELQLLKEDGYFGNITTLRLVYQSSLEDFHDLLRQKLAQTNIACFGSRPSRVFSNADIKTSIIAGGGQVDGEGTMWTSDAIIFTDQDRQEKFEDIQYEEISDFVLREKIGGTEKSRAILPKIGSSTKRSILNKLKRTSDNLFDDKYTRDISTDDEGRILYRRRGVRYWINPMIEELYTAQEVEPMQFESKLKRDTAFLVLNSSLFYTYWVTYGDFHHLNFSQIDSFPFPEEEMMEEYEDEIKALARDLWKEMEKCFDPEGGLTGEFHMRPVKPLVNDVDELLADFYDLTDEEVEFVQTYLTDCGADYGRVGPSDQQLTEVEADD